MGNGVELGVGYITLIPSAKGIAAATQAELGGPMAVAGRKSGAATSAAFKTTFKSGVKNLAVGAGVIAGIAAVGVKFNESFNTIARGTGATGKTLDGLDQSFKNVLKSGSGSFDQVSAAVTTLYQRTGLTGKALDDFASKQVTLARITKTDVAANLQSTTGLFNLYGVAATAQSDKLDVLFRASQVAGVSITQLSSDMQAAAPTAKSLGLTIDQTAALVANLDKAGLPAGKTMAGLATTFAKAAKAGKDPLEVIRDLTAEVKRAPNATAAATIAITKFGIGARQASTLVAGLRSGAIDLNKSLEDGKSIREAAAATSTLSGKIAHLKNEALVGLEPLATATLGALTRGFEDVVPALEFLTRHMEIVGPIAIAAAAGFIAFKTAVGISKLVQATGLAFTALKGALLTTTAAEAPMAGAALTTTAALEAETVAATEAAVATEAAGLALTTAGTAVAGVAIVGGLVLIAKTYYDIAIASTKARLNVKGSAQEFATSLLAPSKNAIEAKASIDRLTDSTKKWMLGQGAASEQTGASIIRNLGLSYKEVTNVVLGGRPAIDAYVKGLKLSDINAQVLTHGLDALGDSLQEQARAQIASFIGTKQISKAQAAHAIAMRETADGSHDYVAALRDLGTVSATVTASEGATTAQLEIQRISYTNLTTAIIANTDAKNGQAQGLTGILSASVSAQQAVLSAADAQKTYADFVAKGTQNTAEGQKALLSYKSAVLGVTSSAQGGAAGAEEWAKQTSGLNDALKNQADVAKKSGTDSDAFAAATDAVAKKQIAYRHTLEALVTQTQGPVHDALVQYLSDTANLKSAVAKVPAAKTTTMFVAHKDADTSLSTWKLELANTATDHTTKLHLDTGPAFQDFIRFTHSIPGITIPVAGFGKRAKGGPVIAGHDYVVGEEGIEILHLNASGGGGFVTSNADLSASVQSLSGSFKTTGGGGTTIDARTMVAGNVYGDSHLKSLFADHDRKLEQALRAG